MSSTPQQQAQQATTVSALPSSTPTQIANILPLRLTNPFNAQALDPGVNHTVVQLRGFLRSRGLKVSGRKADLIERLKLTDDDVQKELIRRGLDSTGLGPVIRERLNVHNSRLLTTAGMYEVHLKKLADVKKESLAKIVPFPYFQKLPPELRIIIWKFSLPGSRVLRTSGSRYVQGASIFRKDNNPENPAALSVCKESRDIALKRYRLVFGTTNLYGDLSSDILYIGSEYDWALVMQLNHVNRQLWPSMTQIDDTIRKNLSALMRDVRRTKNIAFAWYTWTHYVQNLWHYSGPLSGEDLLADVDKCHPRLRRLFLVEGDFFNKHGRSVLTPGYTELVMRKGKVTKQFRNVRKTFCSEKAKQRINRTVPVPRLTAVLAKHVAKVPGEDWEHTWGEPYYPPPSNAAEMSEDAEASEFTEGSKN